MCRWGLILGNYGRFVSAALAHVAQAFAAAATRRLGALFLLTLFLAADAQRRDPARAQTREADLLVAILTLVDRARVEPLEGSVDLAQEPALAVAQAELGGGELFFHRLVDRVATDRAAVAVHAE